MSPTSRTKNQPVMGPDLLPIDTPAGTKDANQADPNGLTLPEHPPPE
jgi:hypothetical protein